jgi:hypothetical protein
MHENRCLRMTFGDSGEATLVADQYDVRGDVCPIDPGFEVDLHVTTHVRTLTRIWLGDLTYRIALTKGDIKLNGPRPLKRHFEQWLGRSTLADVKDARRNVQPAAMSQEQVAQ